MGDPNWLLSALAQSTAAIIAILGGFIISRVIMLFSEIRTVRSEITDITETITNRLGYIRTLTLAEYLDYVKKSGADIVFIESLRKKRLALKAREASLKIPTELWMGLVILILMAIFGLLLPLWLMPVSDYNECLHKLLPLIIFTIFLFMIFAFIAYLIRQTNPDRNKKEIAIREELEAQYEAAQQYAKLVVETMPEDKREEMRQHLLDDENK